MEKKVIYTSVKGVEFEINAFTKKGKLPPLVVLHGFGSTKEDYYDFTLREENKDRGFYAFDLPGLGASKIEDPSQANIDLLVELTLHLIETWGLDRFHICGHSMGGLTALHVADHLQEQVLSFTNIEGNVAPEDTFMSEQVIKYPAKSPQQFFDQFIKRTAKVDQFGYAPYIIGASYKINVDVVLPYLRSIYEHSNRPGLFEKFLNLPTKKMFVHGEENSGLTYLSSLQKNGVRVLNVPYASHFPMNTNPVFLFDHMSQFIQEAGGK